MPEQKLLAKKGLGFLWGKEEKLTSDSFEPKLIWFYQGRKNIELKKLKAE
jgi:hypothetical protein